MSSRTRIAAVILGLIAAGAICLRRGAENRNLPRAAADSARDKTVLKDPTGPWNPAEPNAPGAAANAAAIGFRHAVPWPMLRRATVNRRQVARPSLSVQTPPWRRVLAESATQARSIFEAGMNYLRDGEFMKARLAFQTIIRSFPGDKAEAPAYWAVALSYYREGGLENLMLASDQLRNYLIFFPDEKGLEGFAEAAQIDIAIVEREIMRMSGDDRERMMIAAYASFQAVEAFLKKYPNSPRAAAAWDCLAEVLANLPGQR